MPGTNCTYTLAGRLVHAGHPHRAMAAGLSATPIGSTDSRVAVSGYACAGLWAHAMRVEDTPECKPPYRRNSDAKSGTRLFMLLQLLLPACGVPQKPAAAAAAAAVGALQWTAPPATLIAAETNPVTTWGCDAFCAPHTAGWVTKCGFEHCKSCDACARSAGNKSNGGMGSSRGARAFHSVYYINLDGATERRAHMEKTLDDAGLQSAKRFAAINGSLIPEDAVESARRQYYPTVSDERTFRNTLGCRQSHTDLMRHLADTGHPGEVYLVLEDDMTLPANFSSLTEHILSAAPPGWDVLRLSCRLKPASATDRFCESCMQEVNGGAAASDGVVDQVVKLHDDPGASTCDVAAHPSCRFVAGGAHLVIHRYESLPKVIAGLHPNRINIDGALSMPADPQLNSYCLQGIRGVEDPNPATSGLHSTRCEPDSDGRCW